MAEDEEPGAQAAAALRETRVQCIADDRFALISPELRNSIVSAGYKTEQSRMLLYELDWMDVKEMELDVRQRKELEKFLGLPNGAFLKPPESAAPASANTPATPAESTVESQSNQEAITPCPGRGGNVVSNFPTMRDKNWMPGALKMGPDVTRLLIAAGEHFEPRFRECLDDFRTMHK